MSADESMVGRELAQHRRAPDAGRPRKVILHAPKNGFFFVIDRVNGQLVSARTSWT